MARDDFSEPIRRLLAERSAYRCNNPDCSKTTIGPSLEDASKSLRPGIAAHICAASPGGARFDPNQSTEERSSSSNGIWLCASCAALIDKNEGVDFPAALLRRWKDEHELQMFNELSSGTNYVGLTGWCEEFSGRWKLYIKNPTIVPFYDCVFYGFKVEHFNEPFADIEMVFGTIPPRQTLDETVEYRYLQSDFFGHPAVELEYTDSDGLHWRRCRQGNIKQIKTRRPFD